MTSTTTSETETVATYRGVPRVAPDMDYCFRCVRYSVPCDGHCDCASSVAFCEQWKAEHAQRNA